MQTRLRLRWYLFGALSVCSILAIGVTAFVMTAHGFSSREEPSAIERWIAGRARIAALPSDAGKRTNPVPNTAENLEDARAHWADHCASCHANDGSGDTPMGKRTYPRAPDMRGPETQTLTDGELFYIIENGVRLTAMPAWGGSAHDELDSWKLVHFIRHLPQLTFEEKKAMEKLNPKSPEEWNEQQEEEKFLKGEDTNERQMEHHHR